MAYTMKLQAARTALYFVRGTQVTRPPSLHPQHTHLTSTCLPRCVCLLSKWRKATSKQAVASSIPEAADAMLNAMHVMEWCPALRSTVLCRLAKDEGLMVREYTSRLPTNPKRLTEEGATSNLRS